MPFGADRSVQRENQGIENQEISIEISSLFVNVVVLIYYRSQHSSHVSFTAGQKPAMQYVKAVCLAVRRTVMQCVRKTGNAHFTPIPILQPVLAVYPYHRWVTCAKAVMSSLSWSVRLAVASVGSFSQGSWTPGVPGNNIPEAKHSNTRRNASPELRTW